MVTFVCLYDIYIYICSSVRDSCNSVLCMFWVLYLGQVAIKQKIKNNSKLLMHEVFAFLMNLIYFNRYFLFNSFKNAYTHSINYIFCKFKYGV